MNSNPDLHGSRSLPHCHTIFVHGGWAELSICTSWSSPSETRPGRDLSGRPGTQSRWCRSFPVCLPWPSWSCCCYQCPGQSWCACSCKEETGLNAHKSFPKKSSMKKTPCFPPSQAHIKQQLRTHSQEDPPLFRRWKQPQYDCRNTHHAWCKPFLHASLLPQDDTLQDTVLVTWKVTLFSRGLNWLTWETQYTTFPWCSPEHLVYDFIKVLIVKLVYFAFLQLGK